MDKISLPSYAKINLYLEILGKRQDAYHDIVTIYQKISLKDNLTISLTNEKTIEIRSNNKDVPTDTSNLAYQAARVLFDKFKINPSLLVEIDKNIPIAAGLGGGSSNAASVILGLNRLLKLNLTTEVMLNIAGLIGSDVPVFILEAGSALAKGRGELVKGLEDIPNFWFVLVKPEIKILSQWAYRKFRLGLTKKKPGVKICIRTLRSADLEAISGVLYNDLEAVVEPQYKEISEIKKELGNCGLKAKLVSGSGPGVFGMAKSREEAMYAKEKLESLSKKWAIYVCHSVGRTIVKTSTKPHLKGIRKE